MLHLLENLATRLVRALTVSRRPAGTLIQGAEASVEQVITTLGLGEFNEALGGYPPESRRIAGEILDNLGRLLSQANVYAYPKADITTDAVIFGINRETKKLQVMLIERGREGEPFYGCWAIPGGFVDVHTTETLRQGVFRELLEETHLSDVAYLEQLATFGRPDRDPRGRVITVAYWGCVDPNQVQVRADDDAKNLKWFDVDSLPELAFDHAEILQVAISRLRGKLRWQPVGCWLLPPKFTLRDLQEVYEIILGRSLDARTIRKKVLPHINNGVLVPLDEKMKPLAGRPAQLYRFDPDQYEKLRERGLEFEV